jgi:hypothetical protein
MIWAIFALIIIIGLAGMLGSFTLIGGLVAIALILALVVFGIIRIRRATAD